LWGEQAIEIAREAKYDQALAHALNTVGSVQMNIQSSSQKGIQLLQESLEIALKNSFHEHAARAYSNLGSNAMEMKNYVFAKKILDEGIQYCEQRDLDSWRSNMLSLKATLNLETGDWKKAYTIADNLLKNEYQVPAFNINALTVVALITMRTNDIEDALPLLLKAKTKAFETRELQRIIPSLIALLEYEWLTGKVVIDQSELDYTTSIIEKCIYKNENSRLAFWLLKVRKQHLRLDKIYEAYDVSTLAKALKAAAFWEKSGCPYAQALALFAGGEDDKRKAITIVHELGADVVYERMKAEMRISGIKSIPRGIRKTTQSNPAFLTGRELDVLHLLKGGLQNKEIASQLFISAKTVDHHISSILFKLDVNSRTKAVTEAVRKEIIK
jgi:DNA-binding CsgD family transcriptional regulator